jgi:hypothetical protein
MLVLRNMSSMALAVRLVATPVAIALLGKALVAVPILAPEMAQLAAMTQLVPVKETAMVTTAGTLATVETIRAHLVMETVVTATKESRAGVMLIRTTSTMALQEKAKAALDDPSRL